MIIEILKRADKNVQNSRIDYVVGLSNDAKLEHVEWLCSSCYSPPPFVNSNGKQTIDKPKLMQLKKEMSLPNQFNQRAKKSSDHIVISLSSGETLENPDWQFVIEQYIAEMGYDKCSWMAIKHNDKAHEHIHIIINNLEYVEETSRYVQVKSNNNRQRSMSARVKIEEALKAKHIEINIAPTKKYSAKKFSFTSKTKRSRQQVKRLKDSLETKKHGNSLLTKADIDVAQDEITRLNNSVKSDVHYQECEKELIKIIEQAKIYALQQDKQVKAFLLYLRSRQVSPHMQFKVENQSAKIKKKRISGISFLFKGCPYQGSKLSKELINDKFVSPFSATSLFVSGECDDTHMLNFAQSELGNLKEISDRNYEVKRAVAALEPAQKACYQFSLRTDEQALLTKTIMQTQTTGSSIQLDVVPERQVQHATVLTQETISSPQVNAVKQEERKAVANILLYDEQPQQTHFIIAELSPKFYEWFESLRKKSTEYRTTAHHLPNFSLFKRQQRCYFAIKPDWTKTYQYLIEKQQLQYYKALSDQELQALVKALLEIIKALLALIQSLLGLTATHSSDAVNSEEAPHVISVKTHNPNDIQNLYEHEYNNVADPFTTLKPETFYVDSTDDKKALTALFMSTLHIVPAYHWLRLYKENTSESLLRAIGEHAYHVCKQNRANENVEDALLSKDMLYYLSHYFSVIYDPELDLKINLLSREDVIKGVNFFFENNDTFIPYEYKPKGLNRGLEYKPPF